MNLTAEKVAEALALPQKDRAFLAHQLIISLEDEFDPMAEEAWNREIDRRTAEMKAGRFSERPMEDIIRDVRAKLNANHPSS